MKSISSRPRSWSWFNFPTLSLLALLHRTPVAQVAAATEEFVLASPIGAILKSSAAIAASLGAMNSLAGATPLVPSSGAASGLTVTAGATVAVAYTVTPTQTMIRSWRVGGTIPPGLDFSGRATPGLVNAENLTLAGTATTAGSYAVTIQAFDALNGGGFESAVYSYLITVNPGASSPAAITTQPQNQTAAAGGNVAVTGATSGTPVPALQWRRNGADVAGATSATLALNNLQPANTGLYTLVATNASATVTSNAAIVGVTTTAKVIGTGSELQPTDIHHPNGNIFDQVLLTGAAESITADFDPDPAKNQITRTSYIDMNDDIVQVEFSGPGTLSLVLDSPTGPAVPVNYNQETNYMKGHAGIVITGANEFSNLSVFSVGRQTAVNQALFKDNVTYDGIANIAFVAIATTNGKFGGLRTANTSYFASKGFTGIYAPGVAFQGPVFIGDISAFDAATPVIMIGSTSDARITGGDLFQDNGQAVQVSGLTQLKFTAGGDSHGNALAAQNNRAVLKQNGSDVTAQIVVNP